MKKIKFVIETGFINCDYEIVEEFPDDVTEEQLNDYAEQLLWEHIHVDYDEYHDEDDWFEKIKNLLYNIYRELVPVEVDADETSDGGG